MKKMNIENDALQNNQLEKLKKHYQMYQILTPEQKATLTECKNSMRDQRNNNKQQGAGAHNHH